MLCVPSDVNTITMDRKSPMYKFRPTGTKKYDVHYIVRHHLLDALHTDGEVLPFSLGSFDTVYDMDHRVRHGNKPPPTTTDQVVQFCCDLRELTTLDSFSVLISCSFKQMEPFKEAMLQVCYHVSRVFWIKSNVKPNMVDLKRYTNNVEVFLVGFAKKVPQVQNQKNVAEGKSNSETPEPWQFQFDYNDATNTDDTKVAANRRNYVAADTVEKFAMFNNQVDQSNWTFTYFLYNCNGNDHPVNFHSDASE